MNGGVEVVGRYVDVTIGGRQCRVYVEESGSGIPVVLLHTAGADSRQYRHMLADASLADKYRLIAFDLPHHGKSSPPDGWWQEEYLLTRSTYIETVRVLVAAMGLDRPIVVGCSMGGSLVLHLALEHPEEFRGVLGFSGAARVQGRFMDWSLRPDINANQSVPSWTYNLMAPMSPENARREVWWIYSQGGPGIYRGDTYFYSQDSDIEDRVASIDTSRCPVHLWTGEYDYACRPVDTLRTLELNPGIVGGILPGIGHFPVAENYPAVRDLIHHTLNAITDAQ
ncbi:alpha/beta hydrolase [Paenarthrobacter sp. DKR-5]|uniref:alpha/beta fold hydrolase n=1 Tax=Paenarthrobacter sp. DKR-5 TaxID=2835535 RepID=UPI001BDD4E2C|nr:alpha/beta hydrolase [Paenarthrobacter sp. DKR-5]MBT1003934.1 alpha/beta hydrolase [Paenarthrobacter sp. DKR-5]